MYATSGHSRSLASRCRRSRRCRPVPRMRTGWRRYLLGVPGSGECTCAANPTFLLRWRLSSRKCLEPLQMSREKHQSRCRIHEALDVLTWRGAAVLQPVREMVGSLEKGVEEVDRVAVVRVPARPERGECPRVPALNPTELLGPTLLLEATRHRVARHQTPSRRRPLPRLHGAEDRRELPAVATPRYLLRDPAADHATPDLVLARVHRALAVKAPAGAKVRIQIIVREPADHVPRCTWNVTVFVIVYGRYSAYSSCSP
jgi:hypothetical protein